MNAAILPARLPHHPLHPYRASVGWRKENLFFQPIRKTQRVYLSIVRYSNFLSIMSFLNNNPLHARRFALLPPLPSRPALPVVSTCLRCRLDCPPCRLDLPPLSSRPAPAVISTCPRCHLDLPPLSSRLKGEISNRARNTLQQRKHRDFSLRFEMTAGVGP